MAYDLTTLDLFYGDLTVNRAYVYARLPRSESERGLSLSGQVRGPRCLLAETLPCSAPLIDMGPGPSLLARAAVPDPVFWSPELPAIYDVTINVHLGGELVAAVRRELGLRWLGARGRSFIFEGKRWVLRGVRTDSTTATLPRDWHDAAAATIDQPDDEGLTEASQFGALTVVDLSGKAGVEQALRHAAQHPAAAMAIASQELPADFRPGAIAPNILVLQRLQPTGTGALQPWAQGVWACGGDVAWMGGLLNRFDCPVIAVRPVDQRLPLNEARSACDALQRDLAPFGQFAGYVV